MLERPSTHGLNKKADFRLYGRFWRNTPSAETIAVALLLQIPLFWLGCSPSKSSNAHTVTKAPLKGVPRPTRARHRSNLEHHQSSGGSDFPEYRMPHLQSIRPGNPATRLNISRQGHRVLHRLPKRRGHPRPRRATRTRLRVHHNPFAGPRSPTRPPHPGNRHTGSHRTDHWRHHRLQGANRRSIPSTRGGKGQNQLN